MIPVNRRDIGLGFSLLNLTCCRPSRRCNGWQSCCRRSTSRNTFPQSSASRSAKDGKGLAYLRDKLGKRFMSGLIVHTGIASAPFGDRIAAAPMDVLWTT